MSDDNIAPSIGNITCRVFCGRPFTDMVGHIAVGSTSNHRVYRMSLGCKIKIFAAV